MAKYSLSASADAGANLDRTGATASFLCAIHCAVMPLFVTALPLLGLSFLASEPVEWTLLLCSALLGTLALVVGYRQHRSASIFGVLGVALVLLVGGRLAEEGGVEGWGQAFMVAGGLTMMGAHLINRKLCRACSACRDKECRQ